MPLELQKIVRFTNLSQIMILTELKADKFKYGSGIYLYSDDFLAVGESKCCFRYSVSNTNKIGLWLSCRKCGELNVCYTAMVFDANKVSIYGHMSSLSFNGEFSYELVLEFGSYSPIRFPITIMCYLVFPNTDNKIVPESIFDKGIMSMPVPEISNERAKDQCADKETVPDQITSKEIVLNKNTSKEIVPDQNTSKEIELNQNTSKEIVPDQNTSKEIVLNQNTAKVIVTNSSNSDYVPTECLQEMSLNFKKLLDQAIGSDITIHVGGVSMKAHKVILRARSPVFEKMFNHDTSEAVRNEIDVKDIRAPIMKEFLTFLYACTIESHDFDDACDIYYAADKYEVLSLRNACAKDLLRHLHVKNACQLLILATNHGDESLKEKILEYILTNVKEIMATESFEELAKYDANLVVLLMRNPFLK